jgi:hypothetical protein
MLLQIQHAATGSIGAVALCGQSQTGVAALNCTSLPFGVKLISSKWLQPWPPKHPNHG